MLRKKNKWSQNYGTVFAPVMLRVMKTPADTFPGALLYLRIYFGGVPFVLILNMESNMLRAVGNSMDPFLYMAVGCVSNIILDFAFVLFFGWGIAGVAIATVLAQIVNMLLLTRNLLKTEKAYRLNASDLKIHRLYLKSMMHLGIPSGLQSSMYAVSNMIIQIGFNTLGTVVVASWAMSSKVDGLYWGISNALGAAVTSFAGQNMGAGKPERIRQCARQGSLMALLISVVLSSALMLLGRPVLGILTEDEDLIDTTYLVMKYIVPYYFTWSAIEVLSAVMRGSGDAVKPVVIIGLSVCLLRIVWIVTVFRSVGSLMILCLSYPISWVVCCICLMVRYLRGSWLREPGKRIYN